MKKQILTDKAPYIDENGFTHVPAMPPLHYGGTIPPEGYQAPRLSDEQCRALGLGDTYEEAVVAERMSESFLPPHARKPGWERFQKYWDVPREKWKEIMTPEERSEIRDSAPESTGGVWRSDEKAS